MLRLPILITFGAAVGPVSGLPAAPGVPELEEAATKAKATVQNPLSGMADMNPMSCKGCSKEEKAAWSKNQESIIKAYVPKFAQMSALSNLEKQMGQMSEGPENATRQPEEATTDGQTFVSCSRVLEKSTMQNVTIELPVMLMTAHMCSGERCLHTLHACQVAEIKEHVPAPYRQHALERVQHDYDVREAELKRGQAPAASASAASEELPVFLLTAESCPEEEELRAWFDHQLSLIRDHVPSAYQGLAANAAKKMYKDRLAALKASASEKDPRTTAAAPSGNSGAPSSSAGTVQGPPPTYAEGVARGALSTQQSLAASAAAAPGDEHSFGLVTLAVAVMGLSVPALCALLSSAAQRRHTAVRLECDRGYMNLLPDGDDVA